MAKAFTCDVCGKYTGWVHSVAGFNFKIGEYHDEFTGTHDKRHEVKDMCDSCYENVVEKIVSIYQQNQKKKE